METKSRTRIDIIKALASERLREIRSDGSSNEQIAEQLGVTVDRVEQLCHELLREPGFEHWSWNLPMSTGS